MQSHLEILKRVRKFMVCPHCKAHYNLDDITIRSLNMGQLVLQAICSRGHSPIITLFVTHLGKIDINSEKISPVINDDVIVIHQNLNKFNGDFSKLFKND